VYCRYEPERSTSGKQIKASRFFSLDSISIVSYTLSVVFNVSQTFVTNAKAENENFANFWHRHSHRVVPFKMTRRESVDDDLLPLSTFSSSDFTALDLAKKRLLITQGDMTKLINDYERATSIELVSLVNENYKAFLKASNDVRSVADKIISLRGSVPNRYQLAKKEVDSFVHRSVRMQEELHLIQTTRTDVAFLDGWAFTIQSLEKAIDMDGCTLMDMDIVSQEYERLHAEIEAMESVIAEGLRKGSPLLRDQLGTIRGELARIRAEEVHKLLTILETLMKSRSASDFGLIHACLSRLQASPRLVHVLRTNLETSISYAHGDDVAGYLEEVKSSVFSAQSLWMQISDVLAPVGVDVSVEVLYPVISSEILSKAPMNVFIPTASNLSSFYGNFSACNEFFSNSGFLDVITKFKTSIYILLHMKRISELLSLSDPIRTLSVLESELFNRNDVLLDDPTVHSKTSLFVFDLIARFRTTGLEMSWEDQVRRFDQVIDTLIPGIRKNSFFATHASMARVFDIENQLFAHARDRLLDSAVQEIASPIIQTLESVKQISALYRVASRGHPTRHSVYIDLAIKGLSQWTIDKTSATGKRVSALAVARICRAFVYTVQEMLVKERSRAGKPGEFEKISAQIDLDMLKLYDFLRSEFPNESSCLRDFKSNPN